MKTSINTSPTEVEQLRSHIAQIDELYQAAVMQLMELKDVDEHLTRSEHRFKTIFDRSNVACKIINQSLDILEINNSVIKLLGFSREEIIGTRILDYSRDDFKEKWQNLQDALWKRKLPFFQIEVCLIRKNGSEAWCSVNTILFEDNNEVFGYTMLEDVTDRKLQEKKKDELIKVVSHELKTPVTTLKAFAQILERKLSSIDTESAKVLLKKIVIQSERLTMLISNLLDVTRIESGKLSLHSEEFNFSDLLSEVTDTISFTTRHHLETQIASGIICYGDASRLEQVIVNLITNATKYSPYSETVVINAHQDGNNIVFTIRDFGPGISKAEQDHIFERFFRTRESESGQIPGLGLGLYICAEIIELHRGRLFVESEPGQGSVFGFTVPVAPAERDLAT